MEMLSIKRTIQESLPSEAFQPQPVRGIMFLIIHLPLAILLWWVYINLNLPWYICILITLVLSQIYTVGGYVAHEAIHGAVVRSNLGIFILGYIGFLPFFISPTLWKFWHCQCHHGNTNNKLDPDVVGTLDAYSENPLVRLRSLFSPGTHHWISYLGLFCLFTLEGQYVLWFWKTKVDWVRKLRFNRVMAKLETLSMFIFWIMLGIYIGLLPSLYLIILPMLLANFTQVSYIMTQHFLRPLNTTHNNDPLDNTISVITHPFVDFVHLNFGYHLEHHLFPSMSSKYAPKISKILQDKFGDRYIRLPFLRVLFYSLNNSRIYLDSDTLVVPSSKKRKKLSQILIEIRSN
jgi:fatty acid desaturase